MIKVQRCNSPTSWLQLGEIILQLAALKTSYSRIVSRRLTTRFHTLSKSWVRMESCHLPCLALCAAMTSSTRTESQQRIIRIGWTSCRHDKAATSSRFSLWAAWVAVKTTTWTTIPWVRMRCLWWINTGSKTQARLSLLRFLSLLDPWAHNSNILSWKRICQPNSKTMSKQTC